MTTVAPHGYRLLNPAAGEVRNMFNAPVPGGALDNAAVYTPMDDWGRPGASTFVLVEAKNPRQWIYPRTQELYRLLDKGVSLQLAEPELCFASVLVCRRMHRLTGAFGSQIGLHAIETQTQYVRPIILGVEDGERKFNEVNEELGYNLTTHDGRVAPMERQFITTLPGRIDDVAERWSAFANHPDVPDLVSMLRDDEIDKSTRHGVVAQLSECVAEITEENPVWGGDPDGPF